MFEPGLGSHERLAFWGPRGGAAQSKAASREMLVRVGQLLTVYQFYHEPHRSKQSCIVVIRDANRVLYRVVGDVSDQWSESPTTGHLLHKSTARLDTFSSTCRNSLREFHWRDTRLCDRIGAMNIRRPLVEVRP